MLVNLLLLVKVGQTNLFSMNESVLISGMTIIICTTILLLNLHRRRQMRRPAILGIASFISLQTVILGFLAFFIQLGIMERVSVKVFPEVITKVFPDFSEIALIVFALSLISLLVNRILTDLTFTKIGLDVLIGVVVYNGYYYTQGIDLVSFLAILVVLVGINLFAEIHQLSYVDELTQIPSRRALEEEASKLTSNYTVAMADIDYFKKFNDTYGHDVGDQVLAFVAAILQKNCKGMAFRYGGEEFTLLFPKTALKDCYEHLDYLRQLVAETSFRIRKQTKTTKSSKQTRQNGSVNVTISIGVAEHSNKNGTFSQVLKAADLALYRAKKKGRNCVSK